MAAAIAVLRRFGSRATTRIPRKQDYTLRTERA